MNLDRFTDKTKKTIANAQTFALSRGHQSFQPAHILQVMLDDDDSVISKLIILAGAEIEIIRTELKVLFQKMPEITSTQAQVFMSRELAMLFSRVNNITSKNKDEYVAIEILFQAMLEETQLDVSKILQKSGMAKEVLAENIKKVRNGKDANSASAEDTFNALEKYAIDFTKLANDGKIDPVIGRDEEIRRTIQVLSRRIKNNPVLIGEPGV